MDFLLLSLPREVLNYIHSIINQYLKYGYSLIPVDKEKRPCVYWKKHQYKRATVNDILKWHIQFNTLNIGIVTGYISQLAVIDIDDLSLLPDLGKTLPEIKETTRVKTSRGYHYYFQLNGNQVKSTSALFGKRLELKSNGNYVVAPPSVINNYRYNYEIPLSRMLPIPEKLVQKSDDKITNKHIIFKIPKYHGHTMDCIRQILKRNLKEGERNNGLFILYNLLIQNKNSREYARKIIEKKNNSLANPLTEIEVKKIYRKAYHYGCSGIREKLLYIRCEKCAYRFKGGQLGERNVLVKNLRLLSELSNTQRGVACLLGTVFDGENPSIYKIAKEAHMDWRIVKKAIRELKEKGFPIK